MVLLLLFSPKKNLQNTKKCGHADRKVKVSKNYWPRLRKDGATIVRSCLVCRVAKGQAPKCRYVSSFTHSKRYLERFENGLCIKLCHQQRGLGLILGLVDMLPKVTHFIPYQKTSDALHVAKLFFQ